MELTAVPADDYNVATGKGQPVSYGMFEAASLASGHNEPQCHEASGHVPAPLHAMLRTLLLGTPSADVVAGVVHAVFEASLKLYRRVKKKRSDSVLR